MENLREKLYIFIEKYGVLDKRTIEVSQELDKIIVEIMKGGSKLTPTGKLILNVYSLAVIAILLAVNVKRVKEGDKGWELAALIPVLIFLANVI